MQSFEQIFEFTNSISPMRFQNILDDAGNHACQLSYARDHNVGRKWAVETEAGNAIVVAGKMGWFAYTCHGDVIFSKTYANLPAFKENEEAIRKIIEAALLEGYPLIGVAELLDANTSPPIDAASERYLQTLKSLFKLN